MKYTLLRATHKSTNEVLYCVKNNVTSTQSLWTTDINEANSDNPRWGWIGLSDFEVEELCSSETLGEFDKLNPEWFV